MQQRLNIYSVHQHFPLVCIHAEMYHSNVSGNDALSLYLYTLLRLIFFFCLICSEEVPLVEFPSIGAILKCPQSLSFEKSAIRGLWFNYDHFSDAAPSYKMQPSDINNVSSEKDFW